MSVWLRGVDRGVDLSFEHFALGLDPISYSLMDRGVEKGCQQ